LTEEKKKEPFEKAKPTPPPEPSRFQRIQLSEAKISPPPEPIRAARVEEKKKGER
jgi:hypothetical protein